MRYRNSSPERRTWIELTDPETGRTLELDPDEEVDLDQHDLVDRHLTPVPVQHDRPGIGHEEA